MGLMVAVYGAIAVAPAAALAASPPTLTSSFTPTSITVGNASALSFTITNPNSSGSLTGIAFADALQAGLVVDNPNGTNGTCGSTSILTAAPGSGTMNLSRGEARRRCHLHGLGGCDIRNTPPTYSNSTGAVSSNEGGSGSGDTQALTVFGDPTVSVTSPKEGQRFDFGQKVIARYTCKAATGAPALSGILLWRRFQRRPGRHLDSRRADVQRKCDHGRRLGRHADDRLHGASRQPDHDHARESDSERHRQLLGQGSRQGQAVRARERPDRQPGGGGPVAGQGKVRIRQAHPPRRIGRHASG